MKMLLKIFIYLFVLSEILFAKDYSTDLSIFFQDSRKSVESVLGKPDISNKIVNGYSRFLIFYFDDEEKVDGITLIKPTKQIKIPSFTLLNLSIDDKLTKVKKIYGKSNQFVKSSPENFIGVWLIKDFILFIDFKRKDKEYYIKSITYSTRKSFAIFMYSASLFGF